MAKKKTIYTVLGRIDVLGTVVDGLKALASRSKTVREAVRYTLDEIYRLLGTTLNMAITRLGDLPSDAASDDLLCRAIRMPR